MRSTARRSSSAVLLSVVVSLCAVQPARPSAGRQVAEQTSNTLQRDTSAALATLKREVEQAEARWRRELVGKVTNRAGTPLPDSEALAEVRRASQTIAAAEKRLPVLSIDFEQLRMTAQAFGTQLDALFEQSIVTVWDMHLMEARRAVAIVQDTINGERGALRQRWSQIVAGIGARAGLSNAQRQQLIDAEALPIREEERRQTDAAALQLDAVARRLALGRQQLVDLVTARASAAREARRDGVPERLSGLVEAHLESIGPSGGPSASSLDQLLASQRITLPAIVDGGTAGGVGLAERIAPMLATRLTSDPIDEPDTWYPEQPYRPSQVVLKVETFYPGRIAQSTWSDVLGSDAAAGWGPDDRLLAVYGFNLFEYGRPAFIDSSDPEITYTVLDITREHPDPAVTPAFDVAWSSVRQGFSRLDGVAADALREADAALVRAQLKPGAAAGLKRFRLSLLDVEWLEDDGTVTADVDFVRQIATDETEPLDTIFLHDRFRVRAVVNARTSLDELECVVFRNGQPWKIGGGETLRLTRAPYDPRVYHSGIIRVVSGPGVPRVPDVIDEAIPAGTTLTAMIPRLAPVKMRLPANARVETTPNQVNAQWKAWLLRAATLAGRTLTNFDQQSEESLGAIPHFHLTAPNRKIEIQLGDYAAMLMLRDSYLRQITPVRDEFRKLHDRLRTDPEALQSFYDLARVAIADPNHPLGNIPVTESNLGVLSRTVPFRMAYDASYLTSRGWTGEGRRVWLRSATREALDYYMAALDSAVDTAANVDQRNAVKLIELTGVGFTPVAERLRPNMLRLREGPEGFTWEPDPLARFRLRGIRNIAEEHIANRELSKAESDVVLTAASLVCFAPNVTVLRAMSLAVSITFAEKALIVDLPNYFQSRADLSFAVGAYAVLGPERMAVAEANRVSGFATALSVIGSVIGLGGDFLHYVQTVRAADAAAAMPGMIGRLGNGGLAEFSLLSTEQKAAYAAMLAEARVAQARPGGAAGLSALHSEVLAVDRVLAPRLRVIDKWRTYHVNREVRDRVLQRAAMNEPAPNPPAAPPPRPVAVSKPAAKPPPDTPEIVTARTREELMAPHRDKVPANFPGEAGGPFTLPNNDTIQLGWRLGAGKDAVVYALDRKDAVRLANWLRPGEAPPDGEFVIKLIKEGKGDAAAIVQRQQFLEDLLTQRRIRHLRVVGGDADARVPFVIQERIPPGGRTFSYQGSNRPATDWGSDKMAPDFYAYIRGGRLPREYQEALLRFFRGIADEGVILEDGHLGNFCFAPIDGTVEAIAIDHDRFIPFAANFRDEAYAIADRIEVIENFEPGMSFPGVGHRANRIHSIDWATMPGNADDLMANGQHVYPSAQFFMAKMLEYDGRYIRFNPATREWNGKHLDLDLVRKYFPELDRWGSVTPQ